MALLLFWFAVCAGNIPKELGCLRGLRTLSLHANKLTGEERCQNDGFVRLNYITTSLS